MKYRLKTSACFECGKRTSNARCKQLGVFEQRCNQALQGRVRRAHDRGVCRRQGVLHRGLVPRRKREVGVLSRKPSCRAL